VKIHECEDWAHEAEAMASYARQSGDEELRLMADRIPARALDRVGELLREIPKGARRPKNNLPEQINLSPREQARIAAGPSKNQAAYAPTINAIPQRPVRVGSGERQTAVGQEKLAEMEQ
jgi:hypothetical protein